MTANFSIRSDKAYTNILDVLPASQRWFSFDVPMDEVRAGNAKRFGMTLWNYRSDVVKKKIIDLTITRDSETDTYWYRVVKGNDEESSRNRTSLWNALVMLGKMEKPLPMKGILKDIRSHWCSPDHVFDIVDIQLEADGSAIWLRLDVPGGDVGTDVREQPLPPMVPMTNDRLKPADKGERQDISEESYIAVRDAAIRVVFEAAPRQNEINTLETLIGINSSSASALINNFRLLVKGKAFKAPMKAKGLQMFVDAIVARLGSRAAPKLIDSIKGHIEYVQESWGGKSTDILPILEELERTWFQEESMNQAMTITLLAETRDQGPSEILREVWVRGPQHAAFRRDLERRWGKKCAVHGVECNAQLRASHIIPWSKSEPLRGDVNNGLLLSVPLDNLFDRGLISFDNDGALIQSDQLDHETAEHFGVAPNIGIDFSPLTDKDLLALRHHLDWHRTHWLLTKSNATSEE